MNYFQSFYHAVQAARTILPLSTLPPVCFPSSSQHFTKLPNHYCRASSTPESNSLSYSCLAMGSSPTTSPEFGQRLLPTLIDQLAKDRPDDLFALVPKSNDLNDGFRNITLRDFATCINSVAFWLEDNLGKSTSFETLAYIGPCISSHHSSTKDALTIFTLVDPRYFILALAASKVGYKVCRHQIQSALESRGLTSSVGPTSVSTEQRRGHPLSLRKDQMSDSHRTC